MYIYLYQKNLAPMLYIMYLCKCMYFTTSQLGFIFRSIPFFSYRWPVKCKSFYQQSVAKKHIAKIAYSCCFFLQSSKTNLHVESFKVTRCYQLPKYRRIFSVVSDIEGLSFFVPSPTFNQSNSKKTDLNSSQALKISLTISLQSNCQKLGVSDCQ